MVGWTDNVDGVGVLKTDVELVTVADVHGEVACCGDEMDKEVESGVVDVVLKIGVVEVV